MTVLAGFTELRILQLVIDFESFTCRLNQLDKANVLVSPTRYHPRATSGHSAFDQLPGGGGGSALDLKINQ